MATLTSRLALGVAFAAAYAAAMRAEREATDWQSSNFT
jgi:hypothetical protein